MRITDKYVFFWGEAPFTNFTRCTVRYLGIDFPSSEHAFMWIKAVYFKDHDIAQKIRKAPTPAAAKALGREVKNFDPEEWSKVSYAYMKAVVEVKFRTNPELLKELLDPLFDGKTFVEASPYDRIWGIGFRESDSEAINEHTFNWGENRLGRILTELREKLKREFNALQKYAGNKTQKEKEVNANTTGLVGQSDSR